MIRPSSPSARTAASAARLPARRRPPRGARARTGAGARPSPRSAPRRRARPRSHRRCTKPSTPPPAARGQRVPAARVLPAIALGLDGSNAGVMSASAATRSGGSARSATAVCAPIEAPASTARSIPRRRAPPRGRRRAAHSRRRGRRRPARAAVAAGVVGDHAMAGALEQRASPSRRSDGCGEAVQQHDRRPVAGSARRPASRRPSPTLSSAHQACTAACVAQQLGRALGLLPEEQVTDAVEDLQARAAISSAIMRPFWTGSISSTCRGRPASAARPRRAPAGVVADDRLQLAMITGTATRRRSPASQEARPGVLVGGEAGRRRWPPSGVRSHPFAIADIIASASRLHHRFTGRARCRPRRSRCSRA